MYIRKSLVYNYNQIEVNEFLPSTTIMSFSLFLLYIVVTPLMLHFEKDFSCHSYLGMIWIPPLFSFPSAPFPKTQKEDGTLESYYLSAYCLTKILFLQLVGHWVIQISRVFPAILDSKRLYYGRFIPCPLLKSQADTICIAIGRSLLGEIEGTCITRVKSEKVPHEHFTITGNLYGTSEASICVKGPGYVTAQDIILPPHVEIIDKTQHIASLMEPIDFFIVLQMERYHGYLIKTPHNFQDGSYRIDPGNRNEKQEKLFIEIWTNGSLTLKETLHDQLTVHLSPFSFHDKLDKLVKKKKITLKLIFIDQSDLFYRIYNCLKMSNIYTLSDLLNNNQEYLMKIEHFCSEDIKQILGILEKYFVIDFEKNKS
uniref:RNA polymerase alpha subunit C-terminal domain-containing protein n=1 Tax=Solanum lycopersicum TaxID=4081 RepID=A0A3Q7J8B1_SOLLC